MSKAVSSQQAALRAIRKALEQEFPSKAITVRLYNSACIRVRVIDARFEGLNIPEREKIVLPLIRQLPEDIQSDITVLLLLPPSEAAKSLMNYEFDNPGPSQF